MNQGGDGARIRGLLDEAQVNLEALGAPYASSGDVPAWLVELQSGREVELCASDYVALSDLTGIGVDVLTGEVSPGSSFAVAMRARSQTAPEAALPRALDLLRVLARVVSVGAASGAPLKNFQALLRPEGSSDSSPTPQEGVNAARMLRRRLRLGIEPIGDLRDVIEQLGIPVEITDRLPTGHHGLTAWNRTRAGWDAVMLVNGWDRWTVQRYTMAHELSHVLFQDRPQELTTEIADGMSDAIASDPTERRAEAFGAELLVPSTGLVQFWTQGRLAHEDRAVAVAKTMWHFGVSRHAATIQLERARPILWGPQDSAYVSRESVSDMLQRAGLQHEWAGMEDSERMWLPSAWLSEETAALFAASLLPVENYATVSGQEEQAALAQLRV